MRLTGRASVSLYVQMLWSDSGMSTGLSSSSNELTDPSPHRDCMAIGRDLRAAWANTRDGGVGPTTRLVWRWHGAVVHAFAAGNELLCAYCDPLMENRHGEPGTRNRFIGLLL